MVKNGLDQTQNSHNLARRIAQLSLTKKASNIKILDVRELTSVTDFFVICSGETEPQVKAIVDEILEKLRAEKIRPWHKEGLDYLQWVLLDYVDVVVHVFRKEVRAFYGLESLWGDAPVEEIEESNEG